MHVHWTWTFVRNWQLGPHVNVAACYDNLGNVYRSPSDFQQAKDNQASAMEICLTQLGPKHVDVAASYNNLGNLYRSVGDFQQTKDNHVRALNIRLK